MKTLQYQIAIFFSRKEDRPDHFLEGLNEAMDGFVGTMPNITRLPDSAPLEIPIVNIVSGFFEINIARSRADLFIKLANLDFTEEKVKEIIDKFIPAFYEHFASKTMIARLGFVSTVFFENASAVDVIKKKYLSFYKEGIVDVGISFNHPFFIENQSMNDIVQIETGRIGNRDGGIDGLSIMRDINVRTINNPVMSPELGRKILKYATDSFSSVVFKEYV